MGRIRLILNDYVAKRGLPDSPACAAARREQAADVSAPSFHSVAQVVIGRLESHTKDTALDDVSLLSESVTEEEAARSGIPEGTSIPPSVRRKAERCLNETVNVLVERGLITSADTLASVLPQMTSYLGAAGITEPSLRQLYAAIYRAFRRRRSLLLLNLEKQIQVEELPWLAAINRFRSHCLSSEELARQTLEEVTVLALTSFPHAILPNKLLQELRALVKSAGLDIPLVDELAADIFMGEFSGKFVESARRAAELLDRSLYATYYEIDYEEIRRLPTPEQSTRQWRFWCQAKPAVIELARLCAARAGVALGTWDPATNGMIIEQQQILTTQNLAALYLGLRLSDAIGGHLPDMARRCFRWICRRQQMKIDKWHARLVMLKNTAYAWRQMIFFLTLLPDSDVAAFLRWAGDHLDEQRDEFRDRFRPALNGLVLAAGGRSPAGNCGSESGRRFLGWSNTKHWLLTDVQSG